MAGNSSFDLVLTPLPKIEAPELTFEQCDEADGFWYCTNKLKKF